MSKKIIEITEEQYEFLVENNYVKTKDGTIKLFAQIFFYLGDEQVYLKVGKTIVTGRSELF